MNPFRLRNTVKVTLLHFWKVIYLCKRVKPCLTVILLSTGRKKSNCLFFPGKEDFGESRASLVCTARCKGHLAKHGVSHTCLPTAVLLHWTPSSGMPRGDPQVPATGIQFLFQNSNSSSSLFQCSSLQTKASFGTGLYLIYTCIYKAVSQIRSSKYWLEVFHF